MKSHFRLMMLKLGLVAGAVIAAVGYAGVAFACLGQGTGC